LNEERVGCIIKDYSVIKIQLETIVNCSQHRGPIQPWLLLSFKPLHVVELFLTFIYILFFQVVERQTRPDDFLREDQAALLERNRHGDLICQRCMKEMNGLEEQVAHKDKEIQYYKRALSDKNQEIRRLKNMNMPQNPQSRPWYPEEDILGAHPSHGENRTPSGLY